MKVQQALAGQTYKNYILLSHMQDKPQTYRPYLNQVESLT